MLRRMRSSVTFSARLSIASIIFMHRTTRCAGLGRPMMDPVGSQSKDLRGRATRIRLPTDFLDYRCEIYFAGTLLHRHSNSETTEHLQMWRRHFCYEKRKWEGFGGIDRIAIEGSV